MGERYALSYPVVIHSSEGKVRITDTGANAFSMSRLIPPSSRKHSLVRPFFHDDGFRVSFFGSH